MTKIRGIASIIKNKTKKIVQCFFGSKKRKLIFSLLLVLLIIFPIYFIFFNKQAGAAWWDSDWFYRKEIPVANSSGGTLTDFQVKILNNYDLSADIAGGKIQSDLDDIRFTGRNGEILDYWIEDSTNNSVDIWLKIPSLETSGAKIYFYYGNSQASVYSDGNKVFDFFDDFNSFDESRWSATGAYSVNNGKLTVTTGAVYSDNTVAPTPQNKTIEMKAKYLNDAGNNNDYSGINISEVRGTVANNSSEDALTYGLTQYGVGYALRAHGSDGTSSGYNIISDANIYAQTLNTDYIIGYTFQGSSNIKYFVKDLGYTDLGSTIPTGTWNYPFYLWFGHFLGDNASTANIDDIEVDWARVRKYASTEPTVSTIGQEEKGPSPVLYLPLDEGFGTTAHDETSFRNDGTIVGATWKDESMCKSGKCLEFDGTGDYVEINDNPSLDLSEELTLEAWIKPQSTNFTNQIIFSKTETPSEPTKIFRSVGPGATVAIAVGTTNAMNITGDRATFATALPDNVGVGDVIQYDSDNDNDIDANDSIAFITERISNFEFRISNASGSAPVPVNSDQNWSLFRAYTSLANAEAGTENTGIDSDLRNFDTWSGGKDLVASNQQWNIACYANGVTADTAAVTIDGWITGANSRIKIYTPVDQSEVAIPQRHSGKAGTGYILRNNYNTINVNYITIDGLEIDNNNHLDFGHYAISDYGATVMGSGEIIIKNNIIHNSGNHLIRLSASPSTIVKKIFNNFVYDTDASGIFIDDNSAVVYNNTVSTCNGNGYEFSNSTGFLRNNIAQNIGVTDYTQYNGTNASNNISSDATAPGTNSKINTTVSFISTTTGSEDFHLAPTDTAAKDSGMDLSGDSMFPIVSDIDGQDRIGRDAPRRVSTANTWDIGADEAQATQIYRSVAPNKTEALETGADNSLTIVGNSATFQRALADNVGVGDALQYDVDGDGDIDASDKIVFISGRVTSYEFLVTTATGGVPTAVAGDNDWSLFRAYTSLANAETGTENTGIDSDLRNFDTWSGGKDLVTSKEQWNITCYPNETEADTTKVIIDGWVTGVDSYLKIKAGQGFEAGSVWQDSNVYTLRYITTDTELVLEINDPNVIIEGIQIERTTVQSSFLVLANQPNVTFNSCFMRTAVTDNVGDLLRAWSSSVTVRNSILWQRGTHGLSQGIDGPFGADGGSSITIENSTIYGNGAGRGINLNTSDNVLLINTVLANFTTNINYNTETLKINSDYNATTDSSAPGANSLVNQTLGQLAFFDAVNGNFSISSSSVLRNEAIDRSSENFNSDINGEKREVWDIGADETVATKIYRSVGPGNSTALATDENHENEIEVTDGIATFSDNLPDRIGVGDAVLIDTNADNAITSADTLLFISKRISSTTYNLQTNNGAIPSDIAINDTYQIFRAYTSLANAEAGTKNTSIPVTFNGGNRDLVTNNEEWNIACYGDGVDTAAVDVDGWVTAAENYIKVYTPVNSNEVGVSQRHNGKWDDNKYSINNSINSEAIGVRESFVKIDGLQIFISNSGIAQRCINQLGDGDYGMFEFSNNIMKGVSSNLYNFGIYSDAGNGSITKVWNNLIYDISDGSIVGSSGIRLYYTKTPVSYLYAYNNIISGAYYGFFESGNEFISINNIVQNCTDGYFTSGSWSSLSDFNISDLAGDAPGANSKNSTTVTFRDEANDDFRLAMNDTAAKGAGINLSNDVNLPITSDIEGEKRPSLVTSNQSSLITSYGLPATSYDVGADQISSTIHNNYSLNLKTNYPQTNFSTADNDQDNFSSGDINLEANKWSHIVYKRNADSEELFINGSKKDSGTIFNFLKTNNGKLYIGAENPNSKNSFKGFIDEIRIYPYARTENEVKKDTAAGSSGRAAARAKEGVSVAIGDKATSLSDGLVGYWKMDESSWNGTVNEVRDASGNNNHGVAVGGASTSGGKFGNGGGFDGTGDGVNAGSAKVFDDIENQGSGISAGAWVKADAFSGGGDVVIAKDFGSSGSWSFTLGDSGRARFTKNYNTTDLDITSNDNCAVIGSWSYIGFTWDGTMEADNVHIYCNGIETGSYISKIDGIGTKNSDASNELLIGDAFSYGYDGQMDEVRLYNRALSADEVKQLYNYAPGPVLHLKMDEKSGTTAFDSSGNGNDGTLTNGPVWENGKLGSALKFDGIDDFIDINGDFPNTNEPRTINMWFSADTFHTGVYDTMFAYDYFGDSGRDFSMAAEDNAVSVAFYGHTVITPKNSLVQGSWYYLSVVVPPSATLTSDVLVYINGVKQTLSNEAGSPQVLSTSQTNIQIGDRDVSDVNFDGLIDDVKIYNYARTPEQILEDMGSSAGASASRGAGAIGSPILDLDFDEGFSDTAHNSGIGASTDGTLNSGGSGANDTNTKMWDKGGKFGGAMEFDGDDYVSIPDFSY